MLSLSGEVFVYQKLSTLTNGDFCVPIAPQQIQQFLNKQIQPPLANPAPASGDKIAVKEEKTDMYRVGFPLLKEERNVVFVAKTEL